MRIVLLIAAAVFVLAGCNANQTVNSSSQVSAGPYFPNYNPYNPVEYAQTNGFYGGR
jgi:uncharacterized lipoprotein YajG